MQRERAFHSGSPLDSFGGFGTHRSMLSSLMGGRDPFDDPFFTRPFGSMFGSRMFDSSMFGSSGPVNDPPQVSRTRGPVIEELNTDDEGGVEEGGGDDTGAGNKKDDAQKDFGSSKDPLVEHPDDCANEVKSKDVHYRSHYNKVEGAPPQTNSVSFQKITYGGINGAYYKATSIRRAGSEGVVLEESRQADKTTGQATHRISRGIHDRGHSVTRELNSDGKVNIMQTLHNMNEGELAGFEQTWRGNADRHLPGWNDGLNFHGSDGASSSGQRRQATWGGWALPFIEHSRRAGGMGPENEDRAYSSGGRPKKVVTINIE